MAPWRPDKQFSTQQQSTQVLKPAMESERAVKQLIRYLKGTQHTCLRLEPRGLVQKVCWNSLVVVTQIGPTIRHHAKVLRDILAMYRTRQCATEVWNRQRSVSVPAKQSSAQPVLTHENCWDSQNFSRNFTTTFQFVSRSDSARHILQRKGPGDSHKSKYDALQHNSGYERNVCR